MCVLNATATLIYCVGAMAAADLGPYLAACVYSESLSRKRLLGWLGGEPVTVRRERLLEKAPRWVSGCENDDRQHGSAPGSFPLRQATQLIKVSWCLSPREHLGLNTSTGGPTHPVVSGPFPSCAPHTTGISRLLEPVGSVALT